MRRILAFFMAFLLLSLASSNFFVPIAHATEKNAHGTHSATTSHLLHAKNIIAKPETHREGASNDAPSVVRACGTISSSASISYVGTDNHLNIDEINGNQGTISTAGDTSTNTPAATCYNNVVWVAWRGMDGRLNLANWSWADFHEILGGGHTFDDTADNAPALTTCNGKLYMGWVGTEPSHQLHIMENADAQSNLGVKQISVTLTDYTRAGVGLSLACVGGQVYVAWLASAGQPDFYLGMYQSGNSQLLNNGQISQDWSDHRVSISPYNSNQLELFWKSGLDTSLYKAYYIPSTRTYYGQTNFLQFATYYAPSVDYEATAYTGTDHAIYYDSQYFFSKA